MNTTPANWVYQSVKGYTINTGFSDNALVKIELLQMEIKREFPDLIWITPRDSLHISLMEMISPFLNYEKEKDEIFIELFNKDDQILQGIFRTEKRFNIKLSEIRITPAAIIIVWEDNGNFNRIRSKFLEKTSLFPGTKPPPDIIYTTIGRYLRGGADLTKLEKFVSNMKMDITEKVNTFRLVQEKVAPMIRYEIVKIYKLS